MQDEIDENELFDRLMAGEAPVAEKPEAETVEDIAEADEQETQAQPEQAEPQQDESIDLSTLPPAVRAQLEEAQALKEKHLRLTQDYAAVHGRLAPTQRRLAELEKLTDQRKAQPGPVDTATPSQVDRAASAVGMTPEQWTKYAKDFPDEAQAFESRFKVFETQLSESNRAQQERIAQLEQRLTQFQPTIEEARHMSEIGRLSHAHPDWEQINGSQEFWNFVGDYVENMPPHMRAAFNPDTDLNRADVVIPLLNTFKKFRQPAAAQPAPAPSRATTARAAVTRLSAAPAVRGDAAPRRIDSSAMNEDEIFDAVMSGRLKTPPPR